MDCVTYISYVLIILLLLFNLFCMAIGIVVCCKVDIVVGVGPFIGVTVISAVIVLICILGIMGLRRKSPRLMWVFVGLSITMFVVSIGFYVGSLNSDLEADVKKVVDDTWKKEIVQEGNMNRIQKLYQCCGRNSVKDYTLIGRLPPKTCCDDLPCDDPKTIEREGCQNAMIKSSIRKYNMIRFLELYTAFSLLLCIGITTWVAIRFKKQKGCPNY